MSTPYSTLIQGFLNRIELDDSFFDYFGVDDIESSAIAERRATNYLKEAVAKLTLECNPSINLNDVDDENRVFAADLTNQEVFLITSLMYELYLSRTIDKLKDVSVNFTPTDLRVFDPSNARSTFLALYNKVCDENERYMELYRSRDRLSGTYVGNTYEDYSE